MAGTAGKLEKIVTYSRRVVCRNLLWFTAAYKNAKKPCRTRLCGDLEEASGLPRFAGKLRQLVKELVKKNRPSGYGWPIFYCCQ